MGIRAALAVICTLFIIYGVSTVWTRRSKAPTMPTTPVTRLELTSKAFTEGGMIPSKYTCNGENISPPLSISGVPREAGSLALIVEDPDAPMGTWDHWVVFDMPTTTENIAEGTEPDGVAGRGSGGDLSYAGPCPPSGTHRYIFSLYALDSKLGLREGSSKEQVLQAMKDHIVGMARLEGKYAKGVDI